MTVVKNGTSILTLEQWERRAGPKSRIQWKDGRSAKESARAWLTRDYELPTEIQTTLSTNGAFEQVMEWHAEPEARLCFDTLGGEPRNSDLLVLAKDTFGAFLIAVEAKADETFGETVADALSAAVERYVENDKSNGVMRIQQLAKALFSPRNRPETPLKKIRYQLLTASAGALREAERRGFDRAVLLVHEFVTDCTLDKQHDANGKDLDQFVSRLSQGKVTSLEVGQLYGPFNVPGKPLLSSKRNLFIGKARRNIRTL